VNHRTKEVLNFKLCYLVSWSGQSWLWWKRHAAET